jgi:ubiquinone/menaquinone biosynthesis C-methylase UbiE
MTITQKANGCALPLEKAGLQPGETVLDLGCGCGSDVLAAAQLVGSGGLVYGIDQSLEVLEAAKQAAAREGITNATFLEGLIENIPLGDESVGVVLSNCVINLSVDRARSLQEAFRVLKPGGRLIIADIILLDAAFSPTVTAAEQQLVTPVLGCANGVLSQDEYLAILEQCGFVHTEIEIYLRFDADRIKRRAEKRAAAEVLNALGDPGFTERIHGSFASVYVTANRPFCRAGLDELINR